MSSAENTSRTAPGEKTATFASVTRVTDETQPGNRKITSKDAPRRKAQAPRNNKRILIRLRKDSNFFDKALQIQLAIRDKLHLQLADLLDMKEINTGFALTPRTVEIQQKILQHQQQWGPLVGLEIAEKDIEWHTYLIKNFPRTITSWDGTELDYKQTIEEAIKEQTGLHPVRWRSTETDNLTTTLIIHFDQPLKSRFRLLGLGDLSFQLTKPPRLILCNTCWLFHTPTQCQKPKVCGNCGSHTHDLENCEANTRCVGCHGPHRTGSTECFALPKSTAHGTRALSKTEHNHAIRQGKAAYERWELSQRQTRPTETTQAPVEDQEARDVEMTEAEDSNCIEPELQQPITEGSNIGNPEETNIAEENMGIAAEVVREADEVVGGGKEAEEVGGEEREEMEEGEIEDDEDGEGVEEGVEEEGEEEEEEEEEEEGEEEREEVEEEEEEEEEEGVEKERAEEERIEEERVEADQEARAEREETEGVANAEENPSLPPLPPPSSPPTQPPMSAAQISKPTSQPSVVRRTSIAMAKQSTIKAAVLRRVQVNPVEPSSDTIFVAHSPPSSPAQQSPPKKIRHTRLRSNVRKQ